MFKYFNSKLYGNNYDQYIDNNEQEINDFQNPDDRVLDDNIIKQLESFLDLKDNEESFNSKIIFYNSRINKTKNNKKRKIKKMKNYNIKKGDWQCKNCYNINFHFRTKCNICNESKQQN